MTGRPTISWRIVLRSVCRRPLLRAPIRCMRAASAGIYTHQRLYVDLVVESGACARVTVNFASDGVPAATVAIHEKFGYADRPPAGRYTGYVNLEKWVPFGAVCGGTAVQVTGSGSLTIQAFRLVDASAAALPADIYTATDGNTFRVTQVTADAQALGLPAGDISVLPRQHEFR